MYGGEYPWHEEALVSYLENITFILDFAEVKEAGIHYDICCLSFQPSSKKSDSKLRQTDQQTLPCFLGAGRRLREAWNWNPSSTRACWDGRPPWITGGMEYRLVSQFSETSSVLHE